MSEVIERPAHSFVPRSWALGCADEICSDLVKQRLQRFCMLSHLFIAIRAFYVRTAGWGPKDVFRRFLIASHLIWRYPRDLLNIAGALATPKLLGLLRKEPIIFMKFTWPVYARGFSTSERADLLSNHYRFLSQRLSSPFLSDLIEGGAVLWKEVVGATTLEIRMMVAFPTYGEGEMNLYFNVNLEAVYILSFVVVPKHLPGSKVRNSLFVTRLQGTKGRAEEIRLASKSVGDVSPPLVLIAALQGIALGLDLSAVHGINAHAQVSGEGRPLPPDLISAYDEFWESIEGVRLPSGLYTFPIPLPEKALKRIKQNHRPRVRSRRAFRARVTEQVRAEIRNVREPG